MSELSKAFGLLLSALRQQAGASQEELAFSAGVHRTYISQLERGLKSPSLETIFLLAHALGVKPTELLPPYSEKPQRRRAKRGKRSRKHGP
ncbi:helix-turn-helix domain-containing protein [Bradyrhizobium sp. USDA 223]|uniref:helix-turn-helix domain-containing protein n=1 Tax=Bradyrhizobium sp. USDA 223 TaxID=3156306 RepID=UPI003832FD34